VVRSRLMPFEPSEFHGGLERREMLPFIPEGTRSILDVGCSHGRFGSVLKSHNSTWTLTGIEPDPEAAADADPHYAHVYRGVFPDDLPEESTYDCIVLNDVLEHVVDPWAMLAGAVDRLEDGGRIVASIPNVRYVIVVRDLLLRGRWEYADWGVLDRTHLRFFTRTSIESLFTSSGLTIETLEPINPAKAARVAFLVGRFRDMRFQQFAVVARRSTDS